MKNMMWIICRIRAVKLGNMNINIAGAAKRYVRYTQEKTVWNL